MLLSAMASVWHWMNREDHTHSNLSVGYWQISRGTLFSAAPTKPGATGASHSTQPLVERPTPSPLATRTRLSLVPRPSPEIGRRRPSTSRERRKPPPT